MKLTLLTFTDALNNVNNLHFCDGFQDEICVEHIKSMRKPCRKLFKKLYFQIKIYLIY